MQYGSKAEQTISCTFGGAIRSVNLNVLYCTDYQARNLRLRVRVVGFAPKTASANEQQEASKGSLESENQMPENTYNVIKPKTGVPIKAWTRSVPLEDAARAQLVNVAQLPFIYKWVVAMPDVHWGIGATVGSVIPTRGAIIPAAVGVDIGCGMMAVQ